MGRYLYFNTGFQYKFGFGIQNSIDMYDYGNDHGEDHVWTEYDKNSIVKDLEDYKILGYEIPVFENYEKNVHGTWELYCDRIKKDGVLNREDEQMYRVLLACVIYHQLLYCPQLIGKCDF